MGGLARFSVVRSNQSPFGMKWGKYSGVIVNKLSRMCLHANAARGFAQLSLVTAIL